jgi:hypothetical protein
VVGSVYEEFPFGCSAVQLNEDQFVNVITVRLPKNSSFECL